MTAYLTEIDKQQREERKETIRAMWLACHTQDEIAEAVGVDQKTVTNMAKEIGNLEALPNFLKLTATYSDADWQPPIYDIWQASVGV